MGEGSVDRTDGGVVLFGLVCGESVANFWCTGLDRGRLHRWQDSGMRCCSELMAKFACWFGFGEGQLTAQMAGQWHAVTVSC